jgi:hypothetical protein
LTVHIWSARGKFCADDADQLGPPPSGLAAPPPGWLAWPGWLLWLAVACWSVLSGIAMARGDRARAMRSGLGAREAGPPPGIRAGRRAGLLTSLPVWVYCLSLLLSLSALVASVSHAESDWWKQMCLATVVVCQFAALGARSFRAYRDARPQYMAPDGLGPG